MPSVDSATTPAGAAADAKEAAANEALEYYKNQISQLEAELADFQASSRELEQELEKELEASEKQHRELRQKNEGLRYEVEEWKNKYNQSKKESNAAQNTLQKEITSLRDTNRTMQLRLRDIEVSNDDFERQERIVKSSLEDLESKYNQAIERGVMWEEEVKMGEQEREALRIECQRLRDELSDLKVEQDITVEKLNGALSMAARYNGSLHHVPPPTFRSPLSEASSVISDPPMTPTTTPSASTATPQSDHSPTPPSPPTSESSATPSHSSRITAPLDPATTPRPTHYQKKGARKHSRGQSISNGTALPVPAAPPSKSLHQIRGLIGQMQRLEQRVQNARSKLPGPASTPPRASPRPGETGIPSTITMRSRSHRKRPVSTTSSATDSDSPHVSRLSFSAIDRPQSRTFNRPSSRAGDSSRPTSRASGATSRSSMAGAMDRPSGIPQRPGSRQSLSGRVTPMDTQFEVDHMGRPRRSFGKDDAILTTGTRRNTFSRADGTGIPTPSGLPRRSLTGRRQSMVDIDGSGIGGITGKRQVQQTQADHSDLGETY